MAGALATDRDVTCRALEETLRELDAALSEMETAISHAAVVVAELRAERTQAASQLAAWRHQPLVNVH